jgi:hypothetical protein
MGVKKTPKKIEKNQNFFWCEFLSPFWAFLGEGSPKTPQNNIEKIFAPVTFLASDVPTCHGGPCLF